MPTALTSLKGVFIGWNLTDSSENYLNFFNGDVNDLTFKQCDINGVQTLTMIAVYESNIAEFIMCLSTDDGLSNEEKAVYTFNYRENTTCIIKT